MHKLNCTYFIFFLCCFTSEVALAQKYVLISQTWRSDLKQDIRVRSSGIGLGIGGYGFGLGFAVTFSSFDACDKAARAIKSETNTTGTEITKPAKSQELNGVYRYVRQNDDFIFSEMVYCLPK